MENTLDWTRHICSKSTESELLVTAKNCFWGWAKQQDEAAVNQYLTLLYLVDDEKSTRNGHNMWLGGGAHL